jgi:hypothetical protein
VNPAFLSTRTDTASCAVGDCTVGCIDFDVFCENERVSGTATVTYFQYFKPFLRKFDFHVAIVLKEVIKCALKTQNITLISSAL